MKDKHSKITIKYWIHKFGYNFFSYPKLCMFEIFELIDGYLEEHPTSSTSSKRLTETELKHFIFNMNKDKTKLNSGGKNNKTKLS